MNSSFIFSSDYKLGHAALFLLVGGSLLTIFCLVQFKIMQGVLNSPQVYLGEDKTVLYNISSNTDRSFFSDSADVKFNRYYALFDKDGIRYAAHNKTINFRAYLTYKLYLPLEWDR